VIAASDAIIAGESLTQEFHKRGATPTDRLALQYSGAGIRALYPKKFGTTPVWRELFCSKSGRTSA
jgi:hypothetical protein